MGEPAGIGGEITLKAWVNRTANDVPFFAVDDPARLAALASVLKINCPVRAIAAPGEAAAVFATALPVLPVPVKLATKVEPGRPDVANGPAVVSSIDTAVAAVKAGTASGVVTNPIHKAVLQASGFGFPGHTEYLGHLTGGPAPVMMLAVPELRVVPVTVHLAISAVPKALTTDAIIHCGTVTAAALKTDFGIKAPRIAVSALNPHAGEQGKMGDEETRIIAPAIAALKAAGINATGPSPADTLFHVDARTAYDAVLCMYHDQALIPLKTLDFANGVNVTLGLSIVRTSPDHGTAFDIAGKGVADPSSLIAALRLAGDIATARRAAHV